MLLHVSSIYVINLGKVLIRLDLLIGWSFTAYRQYFSHATANQTEKQKYSLFLPSQKHFNCVLIYYTKYFQLTYDEFHTQ